ncbi:MAG TPA: FAD-binding domain-containing protein [Chitinophagaceae bacterium]|nr:FAD-binding domain-containing protein [Chitinophagaceae bacterium]
MYLPTDYQEILVQLDHTDPVKYAADRNFIDGHVSYLSPYISRGVISTKQVLNILLAKGFALEQIEKFIQELAWREYFQRVWQQLGDDMFDDIRRSNTGTRHRQIPAALMNAKTGIQAIDKGINELYETGYMHNHLRMYTASIACNIGKAYWEMPSKWMYYHLLDGDIASNTCSWQWVAGSFSSKQYFCNQENINKYTRSQQSCSYLNKTYQELPLMDVPGELTATTAIQLTTALPATTTPIIDPSLPILLYNSYNLDPLWKKDINVSRILLLEPSHFKQFPVSDKVIAFIISLAQNIEGIQVFTGEISDIPFINMVPAIVSKEHPAFTHYPGQKEARDWMFPEVTGFYNSFFGFWKKCERLLKNPQHRKPELMRA